MPFKDPEKAKQNKREYYLKNREQILKRQVDYRRNNPEKRKETNRNYNKNNRQKINEYRKAYRRDNPEKVKLLDKKRIKFKKTQRHVKSNPRTSNCSLCDKKGVTTHMHHIEYDQTNPLNHTVELCNSCHPKVHNFGKHKRVK